MQTRRGREQWGAADEAADFYNCSLVEIIRWAVAGLVPAHHLRGNSKNRGWWFPLLAGKIEPANVRIREKYVSA